MRFVMAAALLLLGVTSASAAETEPTRYEQGIGIAAGAISGSGVSYIYHSDGPYSAQFAGALWKNTNTFRYNVGFMLRRTVNETATTRLYIAAGLALYESRKKDRRLDVTNVNTNWNTGVGLGVQFFLWGRVGVSVDGDFTFFLNDAKIWFLPQSAVQYHF